MDHEGLEQLDRHLLGQTALVHLQLGSDHDHRTTGVVDPLAEKVLAETSLFALNDVAEGFQRSVVGTHHGATAATVVDQRINSFLQHPLLVADDDLGSEDLLKPCQTVVAVDHPPVEIIEITGGEASAVELHHRTQIGWDHRDHIQHHPLRTGISGDEVVDHTQALDQLGSLLTLAAVDVFPKLLGDFVEGEVLQQLLQRLSTDADHRLVFNL
ncbi:MAG: Uncharacterised protein [Synechococcus sp. CC9902]|nr:MAG: Uncharacterised protein [Synechococcus sp. CC9902]